MTNQMINRFYLTLVIMLQILMYTNAVDSEQIIFENELKDVTCRSPNGSPGLCLLYTECANLTNWRIQNNIQNPREVKKMFCKNDQVHLCCNRTNYYFAATNYISQLNPKGLAILEEVKCNRLSGDRVSNGKAVRLGQYPFMALLKYNVRGRQFLCGGTLITSRFVLTAAHCKTDQLISVRLGEHDLSTDVDCISSSIRLCLPPPEDYQIEEIFEHPQYMNPRFTHDVALLKLKREVKTEVHIRPICLPISQVVYDNSDAIQYFDIAGWGRTENSHNTNVLQHAQIPHQPREVCQRIFAKAGVNITQDHICAGGENKIDTCKGDSGGPLFTTVPFKTFNSVTIKRQVQFGVVSFGLTGCGGENVNAAAYANLFQYMPWITEIIGNNT
ncbi:serine protease grass [Bactrocera dorsalis]|uniref:CLIP domain-containing serine protease n=1 Tax=Bactrocera dorsalis TaxID=27457 RepID=A0A6I9V523_BACDO|nr:serine protease grass [Bactrocera dorsalis]